AGEGRQGAVEVGRPAAGFGKPGAGAVNRPRAARPDYRITLQTPQEERAWNDVDPRIIRFCQRWEWRIRAEAWKQYRLTGTPSAVVVPEQRLEDRDFPGFAVWNGSPRLERLGGWSAAFAETLEQSNPAREIFLIIAGAAFHTIHQLAVVGRELAFACR